MKAVFFIILTLFLMVVQTIVLPSFSWFEHCFDLVIIDVLFLSLISTHYSMVFAVIFIGCIMDSISGAPFFFHVFAYLWIYIIVTLTRQLLFKQSVFFILIISLLAVLIQHALLLFSVFVHQGGTALQNFNFALLIHQAFWGLVFIPPGIWLVKVCRQNWIFVTGVIHRLVAPKDYGSF